MQKILIIGGTGTLGSALVKYYYEKYDPEIHIFSRDENKQKALLKTYPKLVCHVGDITDRDDLNRISHNKYDFVFHCAALKHVEVCEDNVSKTVKINYTGLKNAYWCLGRDPLTKFCFFSTDKAVYPINAYGMSKGLAEKYLLEMNEVTNNIYIFRWGNILGSTGSVLSLFIDQLKNKKPITVTDKNMTRFWLTIEDAVEFVDATISSHETGLFWPKFMKCSLLMDLIEETANILDIAECQIVEVGLRPGEKIHETIDNDIYGNNISSCNYNSFSRSELNEVLYPIVKRIISNG